jgi:hypothetical protein
MTLERDLVVRHERRRRRSVTISRIAPAVVSLSDPAGDDAISFGDLHLHADAEIAVAEQLVERERLPNTIVAAVVAGVDVVAHAHLAAASRPRVV